MKPCDHLSPYLDGRLERAGRDYFESHLYTCAGCRKVVDAWTCTKNGLKNEAMARRQQLTPTDEEAAKLVEWAILDQSSRGLTSIKVLVPLTAAVSFALAFWLGMFWSGPSTAPMDVIPVAESQEPSEVTLADTNDLGVPFEYETNENGHTTGRLGNDLFGLAPSSRLSVVSTTGKDTVLELTKGKAAFQVSPRKNGRRFIIQAGAYQVLVVGTRFAVDAKKDGVRVSVVEGIVEVSEKGGRGWRLIAGEALSVAEGDDAVRERTAEDQETMALARLLGEVPFEKSEPTVVLNDDSVFDDLDMRFDLEEAEPVKPIKRRAKRRTRWAKAVPTPPVEESIYLEETPEPEADAPKPSSSVEELSLASTPTQSGVDLWRQWILDGRLELAEAALEAHIQTHPVDTDAYSLLADCRRKAGKYVEAIETYKKLTAIAGEHQANRARFKAGVLMQENLKNHLGAAAIFDEYLATGKGTPLLRAKATVRLARSLIVLGETDRARMLLRQVIDGYSGSSVAIQAREILNKIK